MDSWSTVWNELYWNGADWLPWLGIQLLACGVVGALFQWWLKKGLAAFLIMLVFALAVGYHQISRPPISKEEIARLNTGLPVSENGITLERISVSHRFLTYHASSAEPLGESFLDDLEHSDPITNYCPNFRQWFSTRRIKQVDFVFTRGGAGL